MKFINTKTILFIAVSAVFSLTTSCEREYLETDPTNSVSEQLATGSLENMEIAINGLHRNMYLRQNGSQGQNGGTGVLIFMDAMGEDLVFPAQGNNYFISSVRWLDNANPNSSNLFYPYDFYYGQIRIANIIIKSAPAVSGDQTKKNKVIGEALAFRAYGYFMLNQIYAKRYQEKGLGVPLRLDDGLDPIARATTDEVYTSINNDLLRASTLLTSSRTNKSHFNLNVIKGLMARVALVQGRFEEAAVFAKEARTGFPLMTNAAYKTGFNNYANSEWIWGYKPIDVTSDYFANFHAYMSRNYGSTQIRQAPKVVNSQLYNLFPATDVRTQVIDPTGMHPSLNLAANFDKYPYTSQKFLSVNADGAVTSATSLGDIPFMRSAEMYLIEIEALARANKEAESKVLLSEFEKNRNPAYAGSVKSGQAYIDEILNSRRLELWGEGFRFLDLKRLNLPLDRTGANHSSTVTNNLMSISATDKRWTWLIPQDEINASKGLVVQNEL